MKRLKYLVLACGLFACSAVAYAQPLTLNFAANTGSTINFAGTNNLFNFAFGTNGFQWNITSETSGFTAATGLNGNFLNGPFNYGPITTNGFQQTATVLGPLGNVRIYDGVGFLNGTVDFMDVSTFFNVVGILNAEVNINLTGVSYSGGNPDLQLLNSEQPGTLDLSFQFAPGLNLGQLSSGSGPFTTSYSGSISVVPEPSTLALAGFGGLATLLAIRRRK
jgi:hypothetical protein